MWDLCCNICDLLLRPTDSLVVTCGLPSMWLSVLSLQGSGALQHVES